MEWPRKAWDHRMYRSILSLPAVLWILAPHDPAFAGSVVSHDRLNQATVEFVSETHFRDHGFGDVIAMHNQHLWNLENWRRLFSQHAAELAGFVMTFPGAEALDLDLIREAFASGTGVNGHVLGEEVFRPWTRRWSGTWSNGSSQYHLWDQTQLRGAVDSGSLSVGSGDCRWGQPRRDALRKYRGSGGV